MGRQLRLADGVDEYDPLITVRGLSVFPNAPLAEQIQASDGLDDLESHFGKRDDVETECSRGVARTLITSCWPCPWG